MDSIKKTVLFVHGGGEGAHREDTKLATSLQAALGADYVVHNPQLPDEDSPTYEAWKSYILKEVAARSGSIILVGHSLGGSVLLKLLSEERLESPVAGLFLIAAPYWGSEDWEVDEYTLRRDFPSHLPDETPIFLYHSRDDEVVPFTHLSMYAEALPHATLREIDGRGHQFNNDLSEVAADIAGL